LATAIAEARRRYPANADFSRWLDAHGLGSISHNNRAALATLGKRPTWMRQFFEATPECSSWRTAENEWKYLEKRRAERRAEQQASSQSGNSKVSSDQAEPHGAVVSLNAEREKRSSQAEPSDADECDVERRPREFDAAKAQRGYISATADALHHLSAAIEHVSFEELRNYEINHRGDQPLSVQDIRQLATRLNALADFIEQPLAVENA
jgi:hypothetical protein